FNDKCAEIYGNISADLANSGTPISSNDIQKEYYVIFTALTDVMRYKITPPPTPSPQAGRWL
ncbi:MAG: hypothetical protein ACKPER_22240, partial [Dolichospermum sp.]